MNPAASSKNKSPVRSGRRARTAASPFSAPSRAPRVFVVIPAFNGASTLSELLRRLATVASSIHLSAVLIVDDGSTDGSPALLKRLLRRYSDLRVIRHFQNQGAVQSVLDGYAAALKSAQPGDVIVRMDADLEHPPEKIPELVQALLATDAGAAAAQIRYPPRAGFDALFNRFAGRQQGLALVGKPFTQFCPGFLAFRSDALRALLPKIRKMRTRFQTRYRSDLVSIDALMLGLVAKAGRGKVALLSYPAVTLPHRPLKKVLGYARLHRRTLAFWRKEVR